MFPNQDRAEFTKDNRAKKVIRFAAMFATRGIDEDAPCVAASRRFLESPFSIFMAFLRVILGFSVSGQKSLATANEAGADITEAVNKWVDETCNCRRKQANKLSFTLAFKKNDSKASQERDGAGVNSAPESNASLEVWKSNFCQ